MNPASSRSANNGLQLPGPPTPLLLCNIKAQLNEQSTGEKLLCQKCRRHSVTFLNPPLYVFCKKEATTPCAKCNKLLLNTSKMDKTPKLMPILFSPLFNSASSLQSSEGEDQPAVVRPAPSTADSTDRNSSYGRQEGPHDGNPSQEGQEALV